jgi:hypothetical protein
MNRISRTGKVAHDLGLSTRFGGTLFGRVSLNPAVSNVTDERERGRVLNEAWAHFQAANLPAILSTLLGWRLGATPASRAPGGFTPVRSGTTSAPGMPPGTVVAQRLLRFFGNGSLALLAATIVVSALMEAAEPKSRGLLPRLMG